MSTSIFPDTAAGTPGSDSFRHEGMLYRGEREYLAGMVPFVRAGLDADEPVLVAVPGSKMELIRDALGSDSRRVSLRDMAEAGCNPARIIPTVLLAFVDEHPGRRVRVLGEPIWAGRTEAEYRACVQHEALINVAFSGKPATVLCPYDAGSLDPAVVSDVESTHSVLIVGDKRSPCPAYHAPDAVAAAFNRPLPEPTGPVAALHFDTAGLPGVRAFAAEQAARAGLDAGQAMNVQLAVHEAACNAVEHGGGSGTLRAWFQDGGLVCEVRDRGRIADLLAGRRPPSPSPDRGRGLLVVNALSDLVTTHAGEDSNAIRMHFGLQ